MKNIIYFPQAIHIIYVDPPNKEAMCNISIPIIHDNEYIGRLELLDINDEKYRSPALCIVTKNNNKYIIGKCYDFSSIITLDERQYVYLPIPLNDRLDSNEYSILLKFIISDYIQDLIDYYWKKYRVLTPLCEIFTTKK